LRICFLSSVALALFLGSVAITTADTEECQDAVGQLRSAKSDLADPLKEYVACVRDSDGADDCSIEFSNLKSAQDDFESAVSDYASDCGN
jgi:uncharacterized protein YjfI (DUF2170 family)